MVLELSIEVMGVDMKLWITWHLALPTKGSGFRLHMTKPSFNFWQAHTGTESGTEGHYWDPNAIDISREQAKLLLPSKRLPKNGECVEIEVSAVFIKKTNPLKKFEKLWKKIGSKK